MLGRATDPCVDVKPFDGDLYQAKSGDACPPFAVVWLPLRERVLLSPI